MINTTIYSEPGKDTSNEIIEILPGVDPLVSES